MHWCMQSAEPAFTGLDGGGMYVKSNVHIAIDHSSPKSISFCVNHKVKHRGGQGVQQLFMLLHTQTKASHKLYIWMFVMSIIVDDKRE